MNEAGLLGELFDEIAACERCPLASLRAHACIGDGNSRAEVMIVGEAPGANEDELGLPFVGSAGGRLEELLSIAGLTRRGVYITNVCKCRPYVEKDGRKKDRRPKACEVAACKDYLKRETAIVRPRIIVAMGCTGAARLLEKASVVMGKVHGRVIDMGNYLLFPTYHPAARKKSEQAALEDDFANLQSLLLD